MNAPTPEGAAVAGGGSAGAVPAAHAVARLRVRRLALSTRPYVARGSRTIRCPHCRVAQALCLCALRPTAPTRTAFCLLMHDLEPLRPSNTGWLVADVIPDTSAFAWSRTAPDRHLLALLGDPSRQPYVVFPADAADAPRVVREVAPPPGRRPLFVLLDGTWAEARKMFRRSPYLDPFPMLALPPGSRPRSRLRRSRIAEHLCTADVAALCLELAGEPAAAAALGSWIDAYVRATLRNRSQS